MDAPQFPGFEIIATLPHSGMSTVYKARQLALDRLVALKTLPAALASDPADVQQFLTEARITANLKHPNIVQVHDFGQTEQGIYYFVMEFISGYSLGDWIRRKQKLSEEHALLVAQSVAEAMQYAWQEARVVHCDIKPDNVIIDSDGTVKLADLGLAQSMRSAMDRAKTRLEIVYGTPNYISPEQSRGGTALDCRADIYSLGATLYHCLTGQMPFEDAPAATAMDLQITDQIPDALELNPHLSVAVVGLVEKMMAKDREMRQPSWEALLADIRRVLLHQKPDDGAWLPEGASTMQRSVPRETQPRIKVALPPSAPAPDPAPSVPISTTFQNVERRFVLRQQRKRKKKLGWWLAGVGLVGAAVLLLLFGAPLPRLQDSERSLPLLISAHLRERVSGAAEDSPESAAMHQENLRQRFAWVQQWPLTNAFQIREALRQYEQIASDTNATPYAALAAAEIHKLQDLIQQAAAAVMADLEAQTQPLIAQNNFGAAADNYDQYQGAWAAETAASRGAKVRELRGQANAHQAQLSAAAQQAALHWDQLLQQIGTRVLADDLPGALALTQTALALSALAGHSAELADLSSLLEEASRMEQYILDAFRSLQGQTTWVNLTSGREQFVVRAVRADTVQVEKTLKLAAGQIIQTRSFSVRDLTLAEQRLRLGTEEKPALALMRILLAMREPDWKLAATWAPQTGPVLAPVLTGQLQEKILQRAEIQAQAGLRRILRALQIEVAEGPAAADAWLTALRKRRPTEEELRKLQPVLDKYRQTFGSTRFVQEHELILRHLKYDPPVRAPAPSSAPPARAQPAASSATILKEQLLASNPGLPEEMIVIQTDAADQIIRVEIISPALKDLRPLSALTSLRELVCCGAPLSEQGRDPPLLAPLNDLTCLRGASLHELDVSYTLVKDLTPLIGMPLHTLNLAYTRVTDIAGLRNMPLTALDLQGCRIRDINVLRGMQLQHLMLSDSQVKDISALQGAPLARLALARSKVRELASLSGAPLDWLDISDTELRDLSVLSAMPLTSLSMARVKATDFRFLEGLPLRQLDLSGTDIRDLSWLQNMPLQHLNLSGTKLRDRDLSRLQDLPLLHLNLNNTALMDLTPLQNLTALRSLMIMQTKVKTLAPLQGLPLETIWLDYDPLYPRQKYWFTDVLQRMPVLRQVNGQPWRMPERGRGHLQR